MSKKWQNWALSYSFFATFLLWVVYKAGVAMNNSNKAGSRPVRVTWLLMPVLLLPLVATALSISLDSTRSLDTSCDAVRGFLEKTDQVRVSKDATVLILGGEEFAKWKFRSTRGKIAPEQLRVKTAPIISPHTAARCFERTIAHYQPVTTVLFLDPEDGLSGAEATLNALDEIVDKRNYWSVSPGLVVVPPTVTPSLRGDAAQLGEFLSRLQGWAADKPGIEILDTGTLFSDHSGRIDPRLFWPDGSTLDSEGCDLLRTRMIAYAGAANA